MKKIKVLNLYAYLGGKQRKDKIARNLVDYETGLTVENMRSGGKKGL